MTLLPVANITVLARAQPAGKLLERERCQDGSNDASWPMHS